MIDRHYRERVTRSHWFVKLFIAGVWLVAGCKMLAAGPPLGVSPTALSQAQTLQALIDTGPRLEFVPAKFKYHGWTVAGVRYDQLRRRSSMEERRSSKTAVPGSSPGGVNLWIV